MKKQKNQSKRSAVSSIRSRQITVVAVIVVLAIALYVASQYISGVVQRQHQANNLATTEPIKSLVLQANEDFGVAAPLEPRTGDMYFPQAKLYLPAANDGGRRVYKYDWRPDIQLLTIVNSDIRQAVANKIVSAQDVKAVFDNAPELQACTRGVAVAFPDTNTSELDSFEPRGSFMLADGRQVRLFTDKGCPQNADLAVVLKGLRAY